MLFSGAAHSDAPTTAGEDFHLALGAGLYSIPQYPGATRTRTRPFPFIDAEYANRYYSSASDLFGVYAWKTDRSQAGAAIEFDPTMREARDDARLQGLLDVRDTARFKVFASRTISFVTADGNVATDVLGRRQGTLAQAVLWLTAPLSNHLSINVGPGVTWADSRYMQSFYSVPAFVASPLDAYSTHAGILDVHWNGLIDWQFRPHYRIGVQFSLMRLKGVAAASPLTEQRTQDNVVGWLAYTFR